MRKKNITVLFRLNRKIPLVLKQYGKEGVAALDLMCHLVEKSRRASCRVIRLSDREILSHLTWLSDRDIEKGKAILLEHGYIRIMSGMGGEPFGHRDYIALTDSAYDRKS